MQELPPEFRIKREIIGDPLAEMNKLSSNPPDFVPTGRYTEEHKNRIDNVHSGDFLLPEERKLMHHFMMEQNLEFAWEDSERGRFREDFFPPIEMPVIPYMPWVLKKMVLFILCKTLGNAIFAEKYCIFIFLHYIEDAVIM